MKEHETKIKRRCESLEQLDPKKLKDVPLNKLLVNQNRSSSFISPTREAIWQINFKESKNKPIPTLYHPRPEYIKRQEAQVPTILKDKPNPGAEKKHEMFERKYFKICNRLIDKLQKGYDHSKIDCLETKLIHDPSSDKMPSIVLDKNNTQPTKTITHKRSQTSVLEHHPKDPMNNSSSVNIQIDRQKAASQQRENPGPGSSRRDRESRYTTEMSQKQKKTMDSGFFKGQIYQDGKYVIGREFQTTDPTQSFNRSYHGKDGMSASDVFNEIDAEARSGVQVSGFGHVNYGN